MLYNCGASYLFFHDFLGVLDPNFVHHLREQHPIKRVHGGQVPLPAQFLDPPIFLRELTDLHIRVILLDNICQHIQLDFLHQLYILFLSVQELEPPKGLFHGMKQDHSVADKPVIIPRETEVRAKRRKGWKGSYTIMSIMNRSFEIF